MIQLCTFKAHYYVTYRLYNQLIDSVNRLLFINFMLCGIFITTHDARLIKLVVCYDA